MSEKGRYRQTSDRRTFRFRWLKLLPRAGAVLAGAVVTGAVVIGSVLPMPAVAEHEGAAADRAAREIQAARDRANTAAQAMFDAASEIDQLAVEIEAGEARIAELHAEVTQLRHGLEAAAVRRYTAAGTEPIPLLTSIGSLNDEGVADVFYSAASDTALVAVDEFDAVATQLEQERSDQERRQQRAVDAQARYEQLERDARSEIVALEQAERDRVQDAQVQHALERQRREREARERAEREAAERASAASAATPSPSPTGGGAAGSQAPPPGGVGSGSGASAPPAQPAPAPPPPSAGSGMACPVSGPRAFADTWGAPRSGGRSHQGVDMISPGGTPLVAVEAGSANFSTNTLGGNAVWLTGASGTKYYYAHLSAWEGSSRSVSQGEVIGYVGSTGNTDVEHLHFQVHPGGGTAVNPYPYVQAAC